MSDQNIRVLINGFGRIGRTILRQLLTTHRDAAIDVVGINDIAPLDICAYLFEYDSVFGPFPARVAVGMGEMIIGDLRIPVTQTDDITTLDLSDIDVVLECTGKAKTRDIATRGLAAGAKNVLISGPSDAADKTLVIGANDAELGDQRIISNASCTTNALAPLLRLLEDQFKILSGHMTTIHCYTSSQPMIDAPRGDFARSRAGALSMVPTTTSAAASIDDVLPHIAGRVGVSAVRVPTASVSSVDLTVQFGGPVSQRELHAVLSTGPGVIGFTDRPLVSSDLRARPESLIVALPETHMFSPDHARIFGWYDNEWGFSARMIDMALRLGRR